MLSQSVSRRQFLAILPTVPMAILGKASQTKPVNSYSPKFNIGDYVECQIDLEEDPDWYERGEIIGITLCADGTWDYDFIIRDCPSPHFLGQPDQAYEEQLTLLAPAAVR